jgi:peptidoglycan/LPS O-acetylase OafA/YrhL
VFFVISGYLITSILISEMENGNFSILKFYERRARRILPALFVVMLACIPFAWMWMLPEQFKDFSESLMAVVFFASNILFWSEQSGYFAGAAELKPLLHTWSLAVEEQFYIVFPICLLVLWRLGRRWLLALTIAVALGSLALSEWGWRNAPSANFYLAPTRAWELLAGSICAFLTVGQAQRSSNWLSLIGLALIVFAIFQYDEHTPFPSVYALAPVGGTALIILFAAQGTWVARLLSTAPFVGIGLISYSAYLWHQPLFAFARLRSLTEPSDTLMAGLVIAALVLAWATWLLVETPFRKKTIAALSGQRTLFAASGLAGLAFVSFGLSGHLADGLPERFSSPLALASSDGFKLPKINNGYCFYSVDDLTDLEVGVKGVECEIGAQTAADKSAMLFGDSLAGHWEPFWDQVGKEFNFKIASVTTNWCYPAFTENFTTDKREEYRAFDQCMFNREFLRQHAKEYEVLILAGLWNRVESDGYATDVMNVIDYLLKNTDATILVMPSPALITRSSLEKSVLTGDIQLMLDEKRQNDVEKFHKRILMLSNINDRVILLDSKMLFGDYFSSNGVLTSDGLPYSLDGTHISIYGSLFSSKRVLSDPHLKDRLARSLRRTVQ